MESVADSTKVKSESKPAARGKKAAAYRANKQAPAHPKPGFTPNDRRPADKDKSTKPATAASKPHTGKTGEKFWKRENAGQKSTEERPGKTTRFGKDTRPEKNGRPEKKGRPEKNTRPEKNARPGKNTRSEKNARPEKNGRPEKNARPVKNARPEKGVGVKKRKTRRAERKSEQAQKVLLKTSETKGVARGLWEIYHQKENGYRFTTSLAFFSSTCINSSS